MRKYTLYSLVESQSHECYLVLLQCTDMSVVYIYMYNVESTEET
jgi:hypothetical protein